MGPTMGEQGRLRKAVFSGFVHPDLCSQASGGRGEGQKVPEIHFPPACT